MSLFRIPPGRHRARPLRFGLWWNKKQFNWVVKFDESCRYDLQSADQLDTNKLVGIGYLPGHHTDSARFGWRYAINKDCIELMAYCYVNDNRIIKHIADAKIGESYNLRLTVGRSAYWFLAKGPGYLGEISVGHKHKKKLQYRLGCYFGGNRTAPHEMKIKIEKV
jgi:hypothetical protein